MSRQRMYIFERAYVDYGTRLRGFGAQLVTACGEIWSWFWSGPGAVAFDWIIRTLIVLGAIAACVAYVQYEASHGRSLSLETIFPLIGIFVFTTIILWAWKVPVHIVARGSAGGSAAGIILALSVLALSVAFVFFSAYLVLLFSWTALSVVVFVPMRFAHFLWLQYRKIKYRCPYDDDGGAHGLPIHVCSCGHGYDDLQPSFYGIFHHTCRHGSRDEKLPTMDFLGRNRLPRLCRFCKRPLIAFPGFGELQERPIAIIGGPAAGKTIFLRQATRQLRKHIASLPASRTAIAKEQQRILDDDLDLLDRGQVVAKTAGDVMQAFGLAVRVPKRLECLLYLYDAPGEHFLTMERLGRKYSLQHIGGMILLVDPYSLQALSSYGHRDGAGSNSSATPLKDVVSVFLASVNQTLVRDSRERCNVPLAVVLSKADALPTRDFPFLAGLCPRDGFTQDSAFSARCRESLERLGEEHSIRALELKFSNIRYFSCSALGRMPDARNTSPFQPVGVKEPFFWLLGLDSTGARVA